MSGELKVDKISPSTNGEGILVDGNLEVDSLTVKNVLNVEGSIAVLLDMFFPVGSIIPYDKSFPNLPAITGPFMECNGQVISDTESPLYGYRTRNLNGAEIYLDLTWHPDTSGSYTTVNDTDITALSVGDKVVGVGIAEDSYIKEINGTTVIICDTAMETDTPANTLFTNDGEFIRGGSSSGVGQKDAFQGHIHIGGWAGINSSASYGVATIENNGNVNSQAGQSTYYHPKTSGPITDGTNGVSRISNETRPANRSMVYIMRIK